MAKNNRSIVALSACVAALSALTAVPAAAAGFEFSYHKGELNTTSGAKAVFKRLERSVEAYCTTPGVKPLSQRRVEKQCIVDNMRMTVADIDHPIVTAMYEAQKYA